MRRLLLALLVSAGLAGAAQSQILQDILAGAHGSSSNNFSTSCSEANTFLNTRVGGVASGIGTTIAGYYNTLICGLVTDATWAKLDALYVLTAPTSPIAEMNLISTSYTLTPTGGTFTANSDWQGNGTTNFLDTGFVPSTAGGLYTATSANVGVYVLNDVGGGAGSTKSAIGAWDGSTNRRVAITPMYTDHTFYGVVNDTANPVSVISGTVTSGCRAGVNNGTTIFAERIDSGGPASNAAFTTSPLLPNFSIYLGAVNVSGTATDVSTFKVGAAFFGGVLSTTTPDDIGTICTRINAFMTSQGVNAY